jgi:hypothetical protein
MNRAFGASFPYRSWAIRGLLTFGLALAGPATAGDALFAPQANGAPHAGCVNLGPGYFPIKGSKACAKITGYVAADTNFGPARSYPRPLALGFAPLGGASADVRFDTPYGPGQVHFSVGRESSAR